MSLWDKMKRVFGGGTDQPEKKERKTPGPALWIPAEQSPFGVPVLDIASVTGGMQSFSDNQQAAELCLSWGRKEVQCLVADPAPKTSLDCEVRLPADPPLPDGWMYVPRQMEDKWVIAVRAGRIVLARSWTGEVEAIVDFRLKGDELVIERLNLVGDMLGLFGDPVQTFEWVLRSHALGQFLPLPVSEEGASLLEEVPVTVFKPHGRMAACAARNWSPPAPELPLRTVNALVTAAFTGNDARASELVAAGFPLDIRSAMVGYTALHVAAVNNRLEMVKMLLAAGASPKVTGDRKMSVFLVAIVSGAPVEMLQMLADAGADAAASNADGFGPFHAAAEVDNPVPVPWLAAHGLDIEQRTNHGHTPLQIAAGLGHVEALGALLRAGADPKAVASDGKTARDIAVAEGKEASVAALDAWRG